MAESVYRSSDVPDFDTYPLTPPPTTVASGLKPVAEADISALEKRAAALGAAAGKVVRILRQRTEAMRNEPQPDIAVFVGEIVDYTKYQLGRVRDGATARAQEIEQLAREKATLVLRETRVGLARAGKTAQRVADDYPVQVALGAGAIGLLIGIGLRIRKANRA